jgi:putative inorganic carbon (HCO3(-)) transporter
VYQQFFGSNLGHAWLDDDMFTDISLRVYSTLENPNVLGEYLLLAIPVCAALFFAAKNVWARLFFLGAAGVCALCMIYTQSRGCWLGLFLAAAVFILLTDWRWLGLGLLALFLLPSVLPGSIIARFTSIGDVSDSSTSYRVYIWLGTLAMLRDYGLFGVGLGSDACNKVYPV